ncbi:MAG TPA: protein DA1 [Oscillatoriaceae cyanobacterium]
MKRSPVITLLLLFLVLVSLPGRAWAEAVLHCAACGGVIGPGRYLVDQWGDCYHPEHANIPRCVYCGRGISPYTTHGGVHYPDGRDVCNVCNATAVLDTATATELEKAVESRLSATLGLEFHTDAIPVRLVDQATLNRLFGEQDLPQDGHINGLTTKRWVKDGNGKVIARHVSVAILYALPRVVFERTIAHELMHVWMFLDGEPTHTPPLEEGVCNLVSYDLLGTQHTKLAEILRENMWKSTSVDYGEGMRRAERYEQAYGFPGLVTMLRKQGDYPAGY